MADSISQQFLSLIDVSPLSRVRRNHGLEHATLHILARRHPQVPMAGHSDIGGFWILGDVSNEELTMSAREALYRLRNGEHRLAIHPNCGTNFATAGILSGTAAAAVMMSAGRRTRDKLDRLPLAISMATLALVLAQPLGLLIQERFTTSGFPDSLEIVEVISRKRGRLNVHRIITEE